MLPVVNLVIELLIVWGALVLSKLLRVVLDELDDVFCGCDLVVLFLVGTGRSLHHKLSLWIFLPHFLDVFEGILNSQLLLSVGTEV